MRTACVVALVAGVAGAWVSVAAADVVRGNPNLEISIGTAGAFDVNGDGLIDFRVSYGPEFADFRFSRVTVESDLLHAGTWTGPSGVRPLVREAFDGDIIGPASSFSGPADLVGLISEFSPINGPAVLDSWGAWTNDGARHIAGFRFLDLSGQFHYGWFSGNLDESSNFITGAPGAFIVSEFAYESTPGVPITIPTPGTPLTLAAIGLLPLTRRRPTACRPSPRPGANT